ncbi:MAG: Dabb family protein [Clostridiales Family XIII bacterium]|nr:Dabb family protein [Clostridiales Family XIII bacterium]
MIYHIGTFKLADKARASEAADLLLKLKDIVPGTADYKVGINFTDKPTAATVCIIGAFETKEDFEAYMAHPVHTAEVAPKIAELCNHEYIERMASCDFEA